MQVIVKDKNGKVLSDEDLSNITIDNQTYYDIIKNISTSHKCLEKTLKKLI